jgi:hypothetical protein
MNSIRSYNDQFWLKYSKHAWALRFLSHIFYSLQILYEHELRAGSGGGGVKNNNINIHMFPGRKMSNLVIPQHLIKCVVPAEFTFHVTPLELGIRQYYQNYMHIYCLFAPSSCVPD